MPNVVIFLVKISDDSLVFSQFLQNVFSIDTIVKPLPPTMAYNVSRNLSFFTRIFTQFFGESTPSPFLVLLHLFYASIAIKMIHD